MIVLTWLKIVKETQEEKSAKEDREKGKETPFS